jgi:hypothetical protein
MNDKPTFSTDDLVAKTLAKYPDCSADRDYGQFLRFYSQLREDHPLPWDWSDDITGITRFAAGNNDADTRLVFTKESWNGTVLVEVDLQPAAYALVYVTDETGEGLNVGELNELLETLLGVTPEWIESGEDDTPVQEDASIQDNNGEEVPWSFYFRLAPYPSPNGISILEPLE